MVIKREILAPTGIWEMLRAFSGADNPLDRYGITDIRGPLHNTAIHRRHGLFGFEAAMTRAGYERLAAEFAAHAESKENRLSEQEFIGYVLATRLSEHPSWSYLQQLVGYKAERARRARNTQSEAFFRQRLRDLKLRNKGHAELQARDAFKTTVH
jgi:hypothetical protein